MKLTPSRRKLVEAKIKQLYKEVLKESGGQKWRGSINVRGTSVQFSWWSEDPSVKMTESDKYALMATAKEDISYAIDKQDATSGKLNYGDTFVGMWKATGNKLK